MLMKAADIKQIKGYKNNPEENIIKANNFKLAAGMIHK
jgi:hypothetical protein